MIIFNIILIYLILSCIISSIWLSKYLDEKTRYEDDKFYLDDKYSLLFLLGGLICLFFIKQIKYNRKISYFKKYIKHRDEIYSKKSNSVCDKYLLYKRLLKLEKIKK